MCRTNIYDMLQDYASAMATVGDGNSKPTNMINKSNNKTGNKHFDKSAHKAGDKDKNHDFKGKHKKKGPKNGKHCDYCGWDGHDISECRKKKAADEAAISRLYGGIHYRMAIDQGVVQGRKVGQYINQNIITEKI